MSKYLFYEKIRDKRLSRLPRLLDTRYSDNFQHFKGILIENEGKINFTTLRCGWDIFGLFLGVSRQNVLGISIEIF